MTENLTKASSPSAPARELPARGGFDDQVHLVTAAPVDVIDPSTLRSYCGAAVLEIYNDGRDATCPRCLEEKKNR